MVANMLERDKLPARDEAAKELKDLVAQTESHIARQGQELVKAVQLCRNLRSD